MVSKFFQFIFREVEKLYEKGMFSAGQLMGSKTVYFNPHEIRSDQVHFLKLK